MSNIDSIQVDGFKGITGQEFAPKTINLITGRNNTGKTSLLEAIHLSGHPSALTEYNYKIFSLINKNSERCDIERSTEKDALTFRLEEPTEQERKQYFINGITKYLYSRIASFLSNIQGAKDPENLIEQEQLRSTLVNQITPGVKRNNLESSKSGCLKTVLNNNEYPIFYMGESINDLFDVSKDEFYSLISENVDEDKRNRLPLMLDPIFSNEFNVSFFLEEPPESRRTQFIKRGLTGSITVEDEDQKAIKIAEIEDYLKKYELVENLKSFDLDYLVFEQESGKNYQVPFEFMGDGFQAIIHLLWELMDENMEEKVVLIEEPENHMHPGYIKELVHFLTKTARENDIQFFITTHNQDFISHFFEDTFAAEDRTFLEQELSLIQMERHGSSQLDYETAKRDLHELYLDLRSI